MRYSTLEHGKEMWTLLTRILERNLTFHIGTRERNGETSYQNLGTKFETFHIVTRKRKGALLTRPLDRNLRHSTLKHGKGMGTFLTITLNRYLRQSTLEHGEKWEHFPGGILFDLLKLSGFTLYKNCDLAWAGLFVLDFVGQFLFFVIL